MTAPARRQVEVALLERITNGQYEPGVLMPSENELVLEFGLSRNTVRRALAALRTRAGSFRSGATVPMSLIRFHATTPRRTKPEPRLPPCPC